MNNNKHMQRLYDEYTKLPRHYQLLVNFLAILFTVLLVWRIIGNFSETGDQQLQGDLHKEFKEMLLQKLEHLEQKEDRIKMAIDSLEKMTVKVDAELASVNKNIGLIRVKTNEKVNTINTYTISELQQFFADRYDGK